MKNLACFVLVLLLIAACGGRQPPANLVLVRGADGSLSAFKVSGSWLCTPGKPCSRDFFLVGCKCPWQCTLCDDVLEQLGQPSWDKAKENYGVRDVMVVGEGCGKPSIKRTPGPGPQPPQPSP